jgi:hypothetical protein
MQERGSQDRPWLLSCPDPQAEHAPFIAGRGACGEGGATTPPEPPGRRRRRLYGGDPNVRFSPLDADSMSYSQDETSNYKRHYRAFNM